MRLRSLWSALALAGLWSVSSATAVAAEPLLPPDEQVAAVLSQAPGWQAARESVETERALHRQLLVGPHEWTASVGVAQRRYRDSPVGNAIEWEAGLERALRRSGKREAADGLGAARVDLAEAASSLAWREQARALLGRLGAWLGEAESARVWETQVALLEGQAEVVRRRQRLGDAARIDLAQVEAALAQIQARQVAAAGRARAAREALERQFPQLELAQRPHLTEPPPPDERTDWIDSLAVHAPELQSAEHELRVAQQQLRVEQLERRADPVVGLRFGQARDANEHMIGVVVSIPFGGEYRASSARAAASRAVVATLRRDEAKRQASTGAVLRLREAQIAHATWQRTRDAALKLEEAAQGLARAYQLGEGSLNELLSVRRLANEQSQAAAAAAVEAWMARWRLLLEAGRLWPGSQTAARGGERRVPATP